MKRRELERKLRIAGCYLKREGSSHSLWINPKNRSFFHQVVAIVRSACSVDVTKGNEVKLTEHL